MKKAWKALDILKDVDTGVSGSDALNIIEQALTSYEELKRDVKRYFDLGHIEEPSTEQFEEYLKLTEKLLKVGNEE